MKKINQENYKNIMAIFPHPDDEVLGSGGFMLKAHSAGIRTTLVILTKGERGTPDAALQNNLKKIRTSEATKSAKLLHIGTFIHEDLGDGQLTKNRILVKKCIETHIKKIKPDLIITYDPSGLYGHPDHMITSDIVTKLVKDSKHTIKLLYTVLPPFMHHIAKLPTHMANDPGFTSKRTAPNRSFFVGLQSFTKIKALYAHTSQLAGFKKSVPFSLPLATYALLYMREYFHQVSD
jgi:LmbE family N-acetylglucosaminyl deacetylase